MICLGVLMKTVCKLWLGMQLIMGCALAYNYYYPKLAQQIQYIQYCLLAYTISEIFVHSLCKVDF